MARKSTKQQQTWPKQLDKRTSMEEDLDLHSNGLGLNMGGG